MIHVWVVLACIVAVAGGIVRGIYHRHGTFSTMAITLASLFFFKACYNMSHGLFRNLTVGLLIWATLFFGSAFFTIKVSTSRKKMVVC